MNEKYKMKHWIIDIANCKSGDLLLTTTQAEPMPSGDIIPSTLIKYPKMKMILYLGFFLACLFNSYLLKAQNADNQAVEAWKINEMFCAELNYDKSRPFGKKNPYKITFTQHYNQKRQPLERVNILLTQLILLPCSLSDDICDISINSQTRNMDKLRLRVAGLDVDENVIFSDSVNIASGKWSTKHLSVPMLQSRAIIVSLVYDDEVGNKDQSALFDNISIKVGNKDISTLCRQQSINLPFVDKESIVKLSKTDDNTLQNINSFSNKKIIALGESTHGSQDIKDACYQFMKKLILHDSCKVIQLERSADFCLLWNLYVQGMVDETYLERIGDDCNLMLDDKKSLLSFLKWLREYNLSVDKSEKVNLFGIDNPATKFALLEDYFRMLLGDSLSISYTKELQSLNYNEVQRLIQNDKSLDLILDEKQKKYLQFSLNDTKLNDYILDDVGYIRREYEMWKRSEFITNLFAGNNKTVIYSHTAHSNKSKHFPYYLSHNSLGWYLHQHYGDNFFSLAFQIGQGMCTMDTYGAYSVNKPTKLLPPSPFSIEAASLNTQIDYFYIPTDKIHNALGLYSFTRGYTDADYFVYCSLEKRFDGIVFIRDSTPLKTVAPYPFINFGDYLFSREGMLQKF